MACRTRRIAAVLLLSALGTVAAAGSSQAATLPCNTPLVDSSGTTWRQNATFDAELPIGSPVFQGGVPGLASSVASGSGFAFPSGTCQSEQGGRELVAAPTGAFSSAPGVRVQRSVYVPAGGIGFARLVDTWTNTSGVAAAVDPLLLTTGTVASVWRASSSGDTAVTTADDWFVGADSSSTPTQPVLGEIWNGAGSSGLRPARLARFQGSTVLPWVSGDFSSAVVWPSMSLAPGASRSYMHVFLVRGGGNAGLDAAKTDAAALAASPESLYAGLTPAEQAQIVNWPPLDGDGDGRNISADNCPAVANPDQADVDGDGQGDACDSDADGDGLPDAIEAVLGTNPLTADTDGDGKPDAADSCVKLAGSGPDGCPASQSLPGPRSTTDVPRDAAAPVFAIGRVPKTMKRKAFLKGVTATVTCDEPCTVEGDLLGSARSVRLAAAFNVALGSRSLGLGGGARKIKIKPSKRLVGKARKLTVQLRVVATDASGNRAKKVQRIKVK